MKGLLLVPLSGELLRLDTLACTDPLSSREWPLSFTEAFLLAWDTSAGGTDVC